MTAAAPLLAMLAAMSPAMRARAIGELINALDLVDMAREDMEDDDEDCCPAGDDTVQSGGRMIYGLSRDDPGDVDDAEDDNRNLRRPRYAVDQRRLI